MIRSAAMGLSLLLKILALFGLAAISTAAGAQLQNDGPPLPRVQMVDQAGVDLQSGRRTESDGEISIGAADAPAITYAVGAEPSANLPLWGYVYFNCIPMNGYPCGGGNFPEFVMGTKTEWARSFTQQTLTDGSRYEAYSYHNYAVWDKAGAKWIFSTLTGPAQDPMQAKQAYLTSIQYPTGETLTYHYAVLPSRERPIGTGERPAFSSITSSAGYQIKRENDSNGTERVRLINRRHFYCDPLVAACPATPANWPSITRSFPLIGSGTVTFSGLRTVTYGQPVQGGQVATNSQGQPIYEYLQSITSGAGVTRTYAQANAYSWPACSNMRNVRRVVAPEGTWSYAYTVPYSTSGCSITAATATAPDASTVTRSNGDFADELGRTTKHTFLTVQWPASPYTGDPREVDSITYPEGNKATFIWDSTEGGRWNLQSTTLTPKPGTSEPTLTWTWSYPATCTAASASYCNKPTYEIDARGERTDYAYDPVHGGLLTRTLPAGDQGVRPQIRYAYQQLSAKVLNGSGALVNEAAIWKLVSTSACRIQATCAGTADEVVTSYTYDDNLLPLTETIRAGDWSVINTVNKTYDPVGNLVALDGAAPGTADTTRYVYDSLRRVVATMSPDPDGAGPLPVLATRTTYNGDGQPTQVESGTAVDQSDSALSSMGVDRKVSSDYDPAGRRVRDSVFTAGVLQAVTEYSYDSAGRLQCTAVRMNPTAFGALPASACALGPQGSFGSDRIARSVYDVAGQLVTAQRAFGTSVQQDYARYTYSPNGKPTSVTDANGNKATLSYDGLDRQTRWSFPSKTTAGAVSTDDYELYGYDAAGNGVSVRQRDGTTLTYSYDGLNRVTAKTVPASSSGAAGYSVHYGYDLSGLQLYARFGSAAGPGAASAYDALGRSISTTSTMGGFTRELTYHYDPGERRSRVTHPDGTYFTYEYDGLGRPLFIRENGGIALASFTYDALGRRSGAGAPGAAISYGYDALSRLASLGHDLGGSINDQGVSFSYNPASQIALRTVSNDRYAWTGAYNVSRPYSVNGLNQYLSSGSATFSYDGNGNLKADGTASFTFDAENRLVAATAPTAAALAYDPVGRLFQTSGGSAGTTHFLYDGDELVAEYDGGGNLLRRYVHGSGTNHPVAWYEGAGTVGRRSLFADHQSSVAVVADGTGSAVAINSYDPWGIPASGNIGRFQYTGQAWIPELGLYYYKARIYSPTLGRFLQTDPVGYDDQVNLYAYVGNDPVNAIDPSGLKACPTEVYYKKEECIDDPGTEKPGQTQPAPNQTTQDIDSIVVTARKKKKMGDGTKIAFPSTGTVEQGFRVKDKLLPKPFTESGTQTCSDGSTRAASRLKVSDLATGESAGHTHGGGDLDPLPGPEDGLMAAGTGRTAYQMSQRGAFAIEKTAVGFRIRKLSGKPLSAGERAALTGLVGSWNQNNGGSGKKCTFKPNP